MSTTLALSAAQLRKLADALDTFNDMPLNVYVSFTSGYSVGQSTRIATVDAVAALLGLRAEPSKDGAIWYHQARDTRDGVDVRVYTYIDAPAQRCACGAVCTHHTPTGGGR
jgi:hypothetical protein